MIRSSEPEVKLHALNRQLGVTHVPAAIQSQWISLLPYYLRLPTPPMLPVAVFSAKLITSPIPASACSSSSARISSRQSHHFSSARSKAFFLTSFTDNVSLLLDLIKSSMTSSCHWTDVR